MQGTAKESLNPSLVNALSKEPPNRSIRSEIAKHMDIIKDAQDKGWRTRDIHQALVSAGLNVKINTFRAYMSSMAPSAKKATA